MRNQKGFTPIAVLIGALMIAVVGIGAYYLVFTKSNKPEQDSPTTTSENMPQATQSTSQPSANANDVTANWKTYNISECRIAFKHPTEWQNYLSNKERCTIHYTRPAISGQPMDTFIIFDLQPEVFLGQQNIKIDESKIVKKATMNGIEETITYTEEKDRTRPLYLSNKNFFFKKVPIYFRIVSQYEKGDKDFENTLDKIAGSVAINGDEAFYSNYVKNLESELGNFTPKNK